MNTGTCVWVSQLLPGPHPRAAVTVQGVLEFLLYDYIEAGFQST